MSKIINATSRFARRFEQAADHRAMVIARHEVVVRARLAILPSAIAANDPVPEAA